MLSVRLSHCLRKVAVPRFYRSSVSLSCMSALYTPQRYCATNPAAPQATQQQQTATNTISALDVAMKVNKLKRLHQTGQAGKKQIEITAWKELNTLSEEQINNAEGKAVALLLNSWAYFAKHWEKGKDGPGGIAEESSSEAK